MAERAEAPSGSPLRELLGRLAGGASAERARELVDDLVRRGRLTREEADELLDELAATRGPAARLGERAGDLLTSIARDLGFVGKREVEELELRVAQLEHRLALLERRSDGSAPPPAA